MFNDHKMKSSFSEFSKINSNFKKLNSKKSKSSKSNSVS